MKIGTKQQLEILGIPGVHYLHGTKEGRIRIGGNLAIQQLMPQRIEGIDIETVLAKPIWALQEGPDRTGKFRPAPGGVSVGHYAITAGTIGLNVTMNGRHLILSNNHVVAASNDGKVGDLVYQPGPADEGTEADKIGNLYSFVPIIWGGQDPPPPDGPCRIANSVAGLMNRLASVLGSAWRLKPYILQEEGNLVDAGLVSCRIGALSPEILDFGVPAGFGSGYLLQLVTKSGRTSGQTIGTIEMVDLAVKVGYGGGREALFVDQLGIVPGMLFPGDSGSVILDQNTNEVVGLGFAGSTELSVANKIEHVRASLGEFEIIR